MNDSPAPKSDNLPLPELDSIPVPIMSDLPKKPNNSPSKFDLLPPCKSPLENWLDDVVAPALKTYYEQVPIPAIDFLSEASSRIRFIHSTYSAN